MNDDASVYHFTDTARLPWILDSGELAASLIRISSGLPYWRSETEPHPQLFRDTGKGSRGSSGLHCEQSTSSTGLPSPSGSQLGRLRSSNTWNGWRRVLRPHGVVGSIRCRAKGGSPSTRRWTPLPPDAEPFEAGTGLGGNRALGIEAGGRVYLSERRFLPGEGDAYHVQRGSLTAIRPKESNSLRVGD
jgi:hypothetical protein